jgi:hypothetical protein
MGMVGLGHSRRSGSAAAGALLACLLAGCTAPPPQSSQISYVSAIGTPFYIAMKVPVCAATLVVAGPLGALQGLAAPGEEGSLQPDIRPILDAGIADNCGPPYLLPPY